MGISRPSLYAAFGNKAALFRKAQDRYHEGPACHFSKAIAQPTARLVATTLLQGTIDLLCDPRNPGGCLAVQSALATGNAGAKIHREQVARRAEAEQLLMQRLTRAKREGDLPKSANPTDLAKYLSALVFGMSVQASGGAKRSSLQRMADIAMRAWPR
jgi:AcrR family transcriptional regulator